MLKHRNSLQKEPMPCCPMPLLVQLGRRYLLFKDVAPKNIFVGLDSSTSTVSNVSVKKQSGVLDNNMLQHMAAYGIGVPLH